MLKRLSVENYALIDHLEMELDAHLNIITGETGAGKSILLGALGLLLGAKNDGMAMKNATQNCRVEGVFDLRGLALEPFFEENDLDYADETILTRILTPSGKSRAFVNDIPVNLQQMRDLGARLVDIHSQHQNLILSSEDFRMSAIDTMVANADLRARYRVKYDEMVALRRRLAELRDEAAAAHRDEEWLRFQTEELTAANLRCGEQAEIEEELSMLENADRIGEAFHTLGEALDSDEVGILNRLAQSAHDLAHIGQKYPAAGAYADRLREVIEELKDINASVSADASRIDADPQRLEKLSTRLDTLLSLQQKHRVQTEEELIAVRDQYTEKLSMLTHGDEQISETEAALRKAEGEARALAAKLSDTRKKAAPKFVREIQQTLRQLGMPDTVFEVAFDPREDLGVWGAEGAEFLFSANKNHAPQPVGKVASGGELSRVMLALKVLLAQRMMLPTILFDEIDTGVSGRIADAMGEIIARLGLTMQVVDITHLPQVASKGNAHFVVSKASGHTSIRRLTDEERVVEIAKMLSGSEITEAALAQAKILLGA